MKKIGIMVLSFFVLLGLSGCDLLGGEGIGNDSQELGSEYKEVVISNGIGKSVNAITNKYIETLSGAVPVFDAAKLSELTIVKTPMQTQNAESFYSSTIAEFTDSSSSSIQKKIGASGAYKMFTASASQFKEFSTSLTYTSSTQEMYYTLQQNIVGNRIEIEGYRDLRTFENSLSDEFLRDIEALKTGTMTPEQFINIYGTHVVVSGYFGGRLSCYFYMVTNDSSYNQTSSSSVERALSAGIKGIVSGDASSSISSSVSSAIGTQNVETHFTAQGVGGSFHSLGDLDNFSANYPTWAESFNENENYSVLVDIPENGLVSIWDLFPVEYEAQKTAVYDAFINEASNTYNSFIDSFLRATDDGNIIDFGGGEGTSASPYIISSETHLSNIGNFLQANTYFKLVSDISITNWTPIGSYKESGSAVPANPFKGHFDGGGHTITYSIDVDFGSSDSTSTYYNLGLFGATDGATIKNLNVSNTILSKNSEGVAGYLFVNGIYYNVGGIAGYTKDTIIENCNSSGETTILLRKFNPFINVYGMLQLGGIAGYSTNTNISDCSNSSTIYGASFHSNVGGIIGHKKSSTIINCTNSGAIANKLMLGTYGGYSGNLHGYED
ncbi:MAC/Perforin domain protein [Candidatus Izimaplasma bacterium HR1]|jgi:hypothetical protein|uniref:MAC/perforin domain-containing protein n=1 Tax=Candidatus Izimoplasma sp. HR1 TaxID=1541959 RepID=UPI0004F90A9D|nr:MAC/Perforin domain protein [Candidatus Izimaplasma bacterium HR1]